MNWSNSLDDRIKFVHKEVNDQRDMLAIALRIELEAALLRRVEEFQSDKGWMARLVKEMRPICDDTTLRARLKSSRFVLVDDVCPNLRQRQLHRQVVSGRLRQVVLPLGFLAYVDPLNKPRFDIGGRQASSP